MSNASSAASSVEPFPPSTRPLPDDPQLSLRAVTAGSIVTRTVAVLGANLGKVLGVTALIHAPGLLFMLYVLHAGLALRPGHMDATALEMVGLHTLLNLVLVGVAAAPVTYIVFQHMRSRPATLGEAIRQGARRIVPAALASIVVMLLGSIASIFLAVPGIIVFTGLYATIPVVVIERVGVGKALSRSWKLTSGYKGSIFGFMFLAGIAMFVAGFVLGLFHLRESTGNAGVVAHWLLTTLFGAVSAVATAVTYHDLRTGKEGVETEELARIFD
jgi:hypothetical protein